MKKYLQALNVILFGGTLFAWVTVYFDFRRYDLYEETLWPVSGSLLPHPFTTACFYGAFGFLLAWLWVMKIQKLPDERKIKHAAGLWWFLLGGTLFAWYNTGLLIRDWLQHPGEAFIGCSGQLITNPFATHCFIGAALFLLAFLVALLLVISEHIGVWPKKHLRPKGDHPMGGTPDI